MRLLIAAALIVLSSTAQAKNLDGRYDHAPFHEWYETQHNSVGQWCCNNADGHDYNGNYTLNADGTVTVDFNGKPYTIEKEKVLTGPNPTGHAVWWYVPQSSTGTPYTYCFSPGELS